GKPRVNLKEYFCDYFELSISFSLSEFDKEAFLNDVKPNEEKKRFSFVYGSQEHSGEQHAHLIVSFLSDEEGLATLSYSQSREEVKDLRPPYMEDCSQWFGKFFKTETVAA